MDKERLFRHLERNHSSKCEMIPGIPLGVNADEIWEEILQNRRKNSVCIPLQNPDGQNYWYVLTEKMISASEVIVTELLEQNTGQEPHTCTVSTIEEIYYTGFMEGAQISVQDAMHFLQSGEEPENVEELILLNNRQAAGFAAENMYHAIDENYLHNLAYFLTEGLDNGSGDFRNTDNIEIPSMQGESVKLPTAGSIPELVNQFAAFLADTKTHPLIKAAAAHAWILAVRPFPEGNERLARLLSNVILIRAGYSFFGEISISSVIARTSYDYFRAIANIMRTENGADMTYFLEYYMIVLSETVGELKLRRERQVHEMIEEEQQLARMPLSPAPVSVAVQENSDAVSSERRNDLILVLQEKIRNSTENPSMVAELLLEYIQSGKYQFTAGDIASTLHQTATSVRNSLRFYSMKNLIRIIGDKDGCSVYEFCFTGKSEDYEKNKTPLIDPFSFLKTMKEQGRGEKQKAVAKKLLKFYSDGKEEFSSHELAKAVGISRKSAGNYLRTLKINGVLEVTRVADHINYYKFAECRTENIPEETEYRSDEMIGNYSEKILQIISDLESSTCSMKDRRIGKILRKCLGKGFVSPRDYAAEGAISKWNADMRFAAQLGVVEKSGDEYRILTELKSSYETLNDSQKKTLSALYDFFGEDMFSAEMVVAKLDYSSSHISGILHQFTWLRLLDCTANEDHSHIYQLNVNPTDHPECFGSVA